MVAIFGMTSLPILRFFFISFFLFFLHILRYQNLYYLQVFIEFMHSLFARPTSIEIHNPVIKCKNPVLQVVQVKSQSTIQRMNIQQCNNMTINLNLIVLQINQHYNSMNQNV